MLGRDARYVPPTRTAQGHRLASRSVPARAATCSSRLRPQATYAFYDRGLSHYTRQRRRVRCLGRRSAQRDPGHRRPRRRSSSRTAGRAKRRGPASSRSRAVHNTPAFATLVGHRITRCPAGRPRQVHRRQIFHDTQQPRRHDHRRLVGARPTRPRPTTARRGTSRHSTGQQPSTFTHPSRPSQNPATQSQVLVAGSRLRPASTALQSEVRSEAGRHMKNNNIIRTGTR